MHLRFWLLSAWLGLACPAWGQIDSTIPLPPERLDPPSLSASRANPPDIAFEVHRAGRLWTTVNNDGIIGNIFGFYLPDLRKSAPSFHFPNYSQITHGNYIGLWVGGVVNGDTLVSTTIDEVGNREFWPDYPPTGNFMVRSNQPSSPDYSPYAHADNEFQCIYTDTFYREDWVPYSSRDYRKHRPLKVAVTQTSYSWSNAYAADFIIVDYGIRNLGRDTIKAAFVGLYYNGFIWHRAEMPWPVPDEVEGYIDSVPGQYEVLGNEPMQIAYVVDRDGRCQAFPWNFVNTPHALGIAPLRVPHGAYLNNFNWWHYQQGTYYNWAPRKASTDRYPLRDFFGGLGVPLSDKNRYYLMAKPEIDYSSYEAAVNHTRDGWLPPHPSARRITNGHLVQFVTSFGPFTLAPYQTDTLTIVIAMGQNVHTDGSAWSDLYDPRNPYPFMRYLDFDKMIANIRWAKMIYDNPGVDTDDDGYAGEGFWYHDELTGDTSWVYYKGDGVPDLRGAMPPPPPVTRLYPEKGRITIRWNGYETQTYVDPMTHSQDFEGYRVYLSRSRNQEEATRLASWDQENYSRHTWSYSHKRWEAKELPLTIDSLRHLYGEDFDPNKYPYDTPFEYANGVYYFTKVDFNMSDYSQPKGIHRRYPDALPDPKDVDEEGHPRYWEWEFVIDNLLPTVPYYVAVTAFDFGNPPTELESLESPPVVSMQEVFAQDQGASTRPGGQLDVYCWPNPYRIDDGYYVRGFENRLDETGNERARSIWFGNLPNRCTISIYSLDGDLVRRLEHDQPEGSGTASVERWDVVSRNMESVVTGLYYWVVESEFGTQIGKLVILK